MGLNLSLNVLTSGFLVTVVIFFILMGYLFFAASAKMGQVLEEGDSRANNLTDLKSAYDATRVAYTLAFIAAGVSLLLAILYAGHETVIAPSEYWHMGLYLITYILHVISVVYAFIALNRLYNLEIRDRNGADAYLWAGLLTSLFAFVGLTATGSGRLGMNIARSGVSERVQKVESNINEHLPSIRQKVDEHLPVVREKVDDIHQMSKSSLPVPMSVGREMPMSVGREMPMSVGREMPVDMSTSSPRCPGNGSVASRLPNVSTM